MASEDITLKRLIYAHDLWSDIMMLPHNGDMISSEEVEQAIIDAPTVDAVEVVHGRWISYLDGDSIMPDRYYRCSECCDRGWGRKWPYQRFVDIW